jgi:hypothetical protein
MAFLPSVADFAAQIAEQVSCLPMIDRNAEFRGRQTDYRFLNRIEMLR